MLVLGLWMLSTAAPLSANGKISAAGSFDADVDFSTLTLTPVGPNCLLEVQGQLKFSGTLKGVATGVTQALVLAPCSAVAESPPSAFKDVFKFESQFEGTVNGESVSGELTYQGITEVGGAIKANILLKNGLKGNLKADSIVAVGGSYEGFVRVD